MSSELIEQAGKVYKDNFPMETRFERAVFFSWGCTIGDCTFCFMSTQKNKELKETRRSVESILAEFILAKQLGWDIGFFTGGIGVFSPDEIEAMLKAAVEIIGDKLWLSLGPVQKKLLERFKPYIKGVVGSIETINPTLHKKVCPSKPIEPYEDMYDAATELDLKKAMTFIVGMGETEDDLPLLKRFIEKHNIQKIHIYGLLPKKDTPFEHTPPPTKEQQAWWIAQLRISFPKLDIQLGIWKDRTDYIPHLLKAGANSISKYQAIKLFATESARQIEHQAQLAGREFKGTLTELPQIDWHKEVDKLHIDNELKEKIKEKLDSYLEGMRKNHS